MKNKFKESLLKSAKSLWSALPLLLSVVLLVGFTKVFLTPSFYSFFFRGNIVVDPFIGALLGGFLAGNPITSYVLGGELLSQGISLLAVTAFLVSWVTVGVVQFPAESLLLGKKFALVRNILAFFFSIIVAIIVVIGVNIW